MGEKNQLWEEYQERQKARKADPEGFNRALNNTRDQLLGSLMQNNQEFVESPSEPSVVVAEAKATKPRKSLLKRRVKPVAATPTKPTFHLALHLRQPDGDYFNAGWTTHAMPQKGDILALGEDAWWQVELVIHQPRTCDYDADIVAHRVEVLDFPLSRDPDRGMRNG